MCYVAHSILLQLHHFQKLLQESVLLVRQKPGASLLVLRQLRKDLLLCASAGGTVLKLCKL